jgi:hypothetical protein
VFSLHFSSHLFSSLPFYVNAGGWTESDWTCVSVRGGNYISDRLKVAGGPHMFRTEALQLFNTGAEKLYHISSRPNSYANLRYNKLLQQRAKARNTRVEADEFLIENEADLLNPLIVVNFVTPLGTNRNCNLVLYFTRRRHSLRSRNTSYGKELGASNIIPSSTTSSGKGDISSQSSAGSGSSSSRGGSPASKHSKHHGHGTHSRSGSRGGGYYDESRLNGFDVLLSEFLDGSDDFRNCRFKCIPRVADGGWLAKKVVNGTPAILGQKIKQHYFRDVQRNYLEIDVDLNSSMVAGKILSVVNGQAASLVVDLSFILQGESADELPESLLSGVRLIHLKLDKFPDYQTIGI